MLTGSNASEGPGQRPGAAHGPKFGILASPRSLCSQVIVYKMKSKKHYRRLNGHRQPLTKILITKIE